MHLQYVPIDHIFFKVSFDEGLGWWGGECRIWRKGETGSEGKRQHFGKVTCTRTMSTIDFSQLWVSWGEEGRKKEICLSVRLSLCLHIDRLWWAVMNETDGEWKRSCCVLSSWGEQPSERAPVWFSTLLITTSATGEGADHTGFCFYINHLKSDR